MKISRDWLQTYFENPLPDATALADALTFHAFEIESVENDVLDVKVTPNRGHDCLCHRGIAKELSAILNIPLKNDPLLSRTVLDRISEDGPRCTVSIDSPLCNRYIAGYIRGVKVGPSPDWLRKSLESVGQRSINNVVDATNYVMFNMGQPLHAFDAGQLTDKKGYAIIVRNAKKGERMVALDDKEYQLSDSMLVISDGNSGEAIGIAGVKGGRPAGITEATKDIIIESANFDGVSVRKTAQSLKLRTDASQRFEQQVSPELAAYGMRAVADLVVQLAGGEIVGFADEYMKPQESQIVFVSIEEIQKVLGSALTGAHISDVFTRLQFGYKEEGGVFEVHVPFERLDVTIPEDLVEEVARIVGYDKVPETPLPPFSKQPGINNAFHAAEHAREELVSKGYSEVFTSVFADKGERAVLNKADSVRPYLRATLVDGLKGALERNARNKDLIGLKEVKLFEIGTVWRGGKEEVLLGVADEEGVRESVIGSEKADAYKDMPVSGTERYQSFSKYPFVVRDIALWTPAGTKPEDVLGLIRMHAGELLVRSEKFDEFKKGEKTSFAFRLIFQSFDRTLLDEDVNERMESITTALKAKGFEIR